MSRPEALWRARREEKTRRWDGLPPLCSPPPGPPRSSARPETKEGHRDTVEAIVVAFILALVVRGFEAQAFVIPTGSMAPTLMGRHKEIACPAVRLRLRGQRVGRSRARRSSNSQRPLRASAATAGFRPGWTTAELQGRPHPGDDVSRTTCRSCPAAGRPSGGTSSSSVIPKSPSQLHQTAGRPARRDDSHLSRRHLHQAAGRRDLCLGPQAAHSINPPCRSPSMTTATSRVPWPTDRSGSGGQRERRLAGLSRPRSSRYRCRKRPRTSGPSCGITISCPSPTSGMPFATTAPLPRPPRATPVTDFYSYNTNIMSADRSNLLDESPARPGRRMDAAALGRRPDARGRSRGPGAPGPTASVRLELVKAGIAHRCTIDLATGTAVVTRGDAELGRWKTPIKGTGRHHVDFANVDDRVSLMVDGRPVGGDGFEYESPGDRSRFPPKPTWRRRRSPLEMPRSSSSDLVLKRDIYYTQYPGRLDYAWSGRTDPRDARSSSSTSCPIPPGFPVSPT